MNTSETPAHETPDDQDQLQEPTNLLALWPGDGVPDRGDVQAALAQSLGEPLRDVQELAPEHTGVAWAAVLEADAFPAPLIIWAEAAQPLAPGELDVPGATECRWVVGVETFLDHADPLTTFARLVRLLGGCRAVPAVLDVNCAVWHPRAAIEETFMADELEPPADVLWVIQAVLPQQGDPTEKPTWLHTHGLWRCGRPELEMIGVPGDQAPAAASLLNEVAAMILEVPELPGAGERFTVGPDLEIALLPWQDVVPFVEEDIPGSSANRNESHDQARLVICDPVPSADGPRWSWPRQVVRRLEEDGAVVYQTKRATQRQARLARSTWAELLAAVAAPVRTEVLVKAAFAQSRETEGHEHLWISVDEVDGELVSGELVHQPLAVEGLERGQRCEVSPELVSDWQVITAAGRFGPEDRAALRLAIEKPAPGAAP